MSGPTLVVLSREAAEAYEPDGQRAVCISITDPGQPPAALSPKFAAVLRLSFHDLDVAPSPGTTVDGGIPVVMMGPADAGEIVRFAALHADADVLVVHCEAGISRSRSVAEALFDEFARRAPNRFVYQQVSRAFERNREHLPTRWIAYHWSPKRRGPR